MMTQAGNIPDYNSIDREFYYDGQLGAVYSPEFTEFRVWSPLARKIVLNLYKTASSAKPFSSVGMTQSGGVWSAEISGDLHGVYYAYSVTYGNTTRETIDIYAKSAGANGERGMVADMSRTNPEGWELSRPVSLADYTDAVIYELHVRDFSSDASGSFRVRGKFLSFCEKNPVNSFGDRIGLEYVKRLGATHIHLLPVFDFQSVDETDPCAGFNWGYDPLNYDLPEGSYSTDPNNGEVRIKQLKELVRAAHSLGLGIIMDVVYNHTCRTEDSPFSVTFPGYYYRRNPDGGLSNGSGCGNEFASERAMARKFICDSLCFWAEEYKLDGFRFDLMGLLDIETLNLCAQRLKKINPSIILYGEGWTGGASPLDEKLRGLKHNAGKLPDFAMFSDDFRDGVKGSVFSDSDCGYVNGRADEERAELIKSVISAGIYRDDVGRGPEYIWTSKPQQAVNYVEAHDDLTLYDKLRSSMPDASEEEIIAADRLAAALVFLSQGIPFIQAGQEMLRSKPSPSGGFVHDSYNSPDSVNGLKWDNITLQKDTVEYYRGLIAIRKRFPQLRMKTAGEIREKLQFENLADGALAATADGLVMVINPAGEAVEYGIKGSAEVYADKSRAADRPIYSVTDVIKAEPRSVVLACMSE